MTTTDITTVAVLIPMLVILTISVAIIVTKTIKPIQPKDSIPYTVRRKRIWQKDGKAIYAPKGSVFIIVQAKHDDKTYTSFRHIPGNSPKEFEDFMAKQEFEEMREKYNF